MSRCRLMASRTTDPYSGAQPSLGIQLVRDVVGAIVQKTGQRVEIRP
jgi:hypothetical protein